MDLRLPGSVEDTLDLDQRLPTAKRRESDHSRAAASGRVKRHFVLY